MPRPSANDQSAPRRPAPSRPAPEHGDHLEVDDTIMTGEAVALDLRPASFVLRSAGAIIDFVAHIALFLLLILVVLPAIEASFGGFDDAIRTALIVAALVVSIVVTPVAVELLSHGRSLGKLAIGARIVRDDGGAVGFRHAFIRALTGVIEIYTTFGGFAVVVSLLNARSKRLGDLLAGTYSQYERVSKADPPVFGVPVQLEQWALTADVARMPDRLARRVGAFLAQAGKLTPASRVRLGNELAAEVVPYVSPVPAVEAELFLAGVAAVRRDREYTALQLEARGLDRLAPVLGGLPNGFPER